MHLKMNPIQRNAHCGLLCARNLILTAYRSDIYSVYCWIHRIVQFGIIEARVVHLIYELDCIFSFFCQIFANWVFNYEYNLLQSLLNSLFINLAKSKQVSTFSQFLGSLKFRSLTILEIYRIAVLFSPNISVSQLRRFGARASCSFIFSQHFCLVGSEIWSSSVSQLGRLAVSFSLNISVLQQRRFGAWASRSLGVSQFYFLSTFLSRSFGDSEPGRLAAWASRSFIFSQHFCLRARSSRSLGVSEPGGLAA